MRDLNDLQFFAAVVSQGSFSAAARALSVPKSRVSRRVADFEERLGVRLLERSTRSVRVTEIGQHVYEHARASVLEADAIEDLVLRSRAEPRGLVRVSSPLGFAAVLAEAVPKLLAGNPHLRLQLMLTNRRIDLIEEGIDISIRVRERFDTDADLLVKRLGKSARILVAAPGLLKKLGRPLSPKDLTRYPLLHQQDQARPASWALANKSGVQETVSADSRLISGDFGVLIGAAAAGLGVALLPRADVNAVLASKRLEQVLPDWEAAEGILHLVFTSRRGMLPSVRLVIDFLADTLRSRAD